MTTPPTNSSKRPTKRRWLAYSLRTLLIVVTVVAVWLGIKTNQARRQRAAVAAIMASGGDVRYDFQSQATGKRPAKEPPGPKWLRDSVGDEFFQDVVEVSWSGNDGVKADDLRWLSDLPKLENLNLSYTKIGDQGLEHLAELESLKHVLLEWCTQVTDRGLAHLARLERLESLALLRTRCSDEGVRKYVPRFQRLVYLDVAGIPITNETAKEFHRLKNLRMLNLSRVEQRAAHDLGEAVQLLKKELPACRINYWPPFQDERD